MRRGIFGEGPELFREIIQVILARRLGLGS